MTDGTGVTAYAYVAPGQLGAGDLASVDGPLSNDTLTYAYDELGRVAGRAVNGVGATWSYDALGRTITEVNPLGTFTYGFDGVSGRRASASYPNGQTTSYSYAGNTGDHRLTTIHHQLAGGATLSRFDYTTDVAGNIRTWRQELGATPVAEWSYGYDAADQLVSAIKRAVDAPHAVLQQFGYRYDPAGNRTAEQLDGVLTGATFDARNQLASHQAAGVLQVGGTVSEAAQVTINGQPAAMDAAQRFSGRVPVTGGANAFTVTATDASGNVASRTYDVTASGSARAFTYDANGNLTSDGTRTFDWDAVNRLTAVVSGTHRSEFTYDGNSRRVRIIEKESGSTTRDARYLWVGSQIVEERLSTGAINRFFHDGEQHDGIARFVTRDHLESTREVTDSSGTVVTRNDYDPYGRLTRLAGTEDSRFTFTGHLAHGPSGLVLAQYRAYDPTLGRWISFDPAGYIDGPNAHLYVGNRALSMRDLDGRLAFAIPAVILGLEAVFDAITATLFVGTAVGAGVAGGKALENLSNQYNKPPQDAYDPLGAKAPGKPGPTDGFFEPKGGEVWVRNPNGSGAGWLDANGKVWVPTGPGPGAHGGPHWDVQDPATGRHTNVRPPQMCRR